MVDTSSYIARFDGAIHSLFGDAVRLSLKDPVALHFFTQMARAQTRAAKRRAVWEKQGVHVPPLLILSVTGRCNLACAGCYARAQQRKDEREMTSEELLEVVQEGCDLGIGIMLLAGGEPMVRAEDLVALGQAAPEVIFPVFTNGTLIDDALVERLRTQRNLVPVVSLEGHGAQTDARRGQGVARKAEDALARLRRAGIFCGTSITVTRANAGLVLREEYIREVMALGCRVFFFVEYVPVCEGTESLVLTGGQRQALMQAMERFHDDLPGLFIAFPGDESAYGGCLAAGRGFVHISPGGRVEACPFAPYADTTVQNGGLRAALESPLLSAIRDAHGRLAETDGGCALWAQRAWIRSLLSEVRGKETHEG